VDKALELLIAFSTRLPTASDERGQGTLEYVGMILVAAIIVVAVLQATDAVDLGSVFRDAIESVTG
jgi:hypothetical protein